MKIILISVLVLGACWGGSWGMARGVTGPWIAARTTVFSGGLLGIALCGAIAFALLFALDPDPVFGADDWLSRGRRTAPWVGLSAILWLPMFLTFYSRRRRATG